MKHKSKSLMFEIWGYFVTFAVVIMLALWLLQTVFLNTFYTSMKTSEIKKIGEKIITEYGKSDFETLLFNQSYNNGLVIQVFNQNGEPQYSSNVWVGGMSPPQTDQRTVKELIGKLSQSTNGRTSYITNDPRINGKILVYGALLSNNPDEKLYLYINSQIAPIGSTTSVLQSILLIVMIISLVISFVISALIAYKFSHPITKITETAKELAKGNYNVKFEPGKLAEINQLVSTLNYATQELSKTDELRRDLIANISHDLRTPLTMVKMYAELIRDVSGENPDKRNAHAQIIIEESDRLSALITDMLDLSKLQSGTAQLNYKKFCLDEKAKVIMNRFNAFSEREGYVFQFESFGDTTVFADEQKIERVIYNLISNAVNYTGKDKTVKISVKKCDEKVKFAVTDTGVGIPEDERLQIWERYYKVNRTDEQRAKGNGLGLYIVKSILEAHHAAYGVESKLNEGSTFWFEI